MPLKKSQKVDMRPLICSCGCRKRLSDKPKH